MTEARSSTSQPPVLVILGPTASGKTSLALHVARKTDAEIISADSRQVYRELTIGTAKPSPAELAAVPHHFIDEKNIGEHFSAGDFASQAERRVLEIHNRGKRAIVAGGSTLYLEALLKGLADLPPSDPEIRKALYTKWEKHGGEKLFQRLRQADPQQAATLDPTKTQRVIRSLEIIELSKRTVTELQRSRKPPRLNFRAYALRMPRERLYQRIDRRVEVMMAAGLEEEAKRLYERYRTILHTQRAGVLKTVGYQELFRYFEDETDLETAISLIKQHSRNYAKRQLTFFKNRLNVNWVDFSGDDDIPAVLVDRFLGALGNA